MSNKSVREELEKIYGRICMLHKGLKINGYSKSKVKYKGRSIERQLTLHHIKPKSKGGATNKENGAILCRGCHDFLEQTTPENRERINELLRKYKKCVIELGEDFTTGIEIDLAEVELEGRELIAKQKVIYNRTEEKRKLNKAREEYQRDDIDT